MSESTELIISNSDQLFQPTTRRKFLGILGVAGSVVFLPSVFTACSDSDNPVDPTLDPSLYKLNLSDDFGILNYAYALEQLEAAFYTAALTSPGFNALSANDQEMITDIQRHEVIHREFFKAALGTTHAIPTIAFNATTVGNLVSTKDSLLKTSQLLEDTGVSAYNGAGKYLQNTTYLTLAGKIVSVEARHAAAIRDARDATGKLFAGDDVVNPSGLDVKAEPGTVLASVASLNVLVSPVSKGTDPTITPATADQPAPAPV